MIKRIFIKLYLYVKKVCKQQNISFFFNADWSNKDPDANVTLTLTSNSQNGESCLHAAAVSGDAGLVSLLLAAGADPELAAMSGVLPLELAPPPPAPGDPGSAKTLLAAVTTTTRSSYSNGGPVYRSLTPDKLSALRSGSSMLIR